MFLLDLNAFLCSLNLCVKLCPICPTHALLQSGHVSLYALDVLCLSRVWGFGINSFWRVLLVRSVILSSAFLKSFVIKVVSLPMYVKGAHFCVVITVFWLGVMVVCLGWGLCVCVDREPIVQHDVVDGVQFFFVFVILQVVCVQSVIQIPFGSVLELGWVVQGIWDNAVCEGWFPVCGGYPFCWSLANSNDQKIYLVVGFQFCCELHVWVERINPFQPSDAMWHHTFHLSLICMSFAQ